jgi:hypothetical protein
MSGVHGEEPATPSQTTLGSSVSAAEPNEASTRTSRTDLNTNVEVETPSVDVERSSSSVAPSDATYPPPRSISNERVMPDLPQVDRGRAAYLFLLAAFTVEMVVWGVPSSYGVFLQYYQREGVGAGDKSGAGLLPLVGAFSSGLMCTASSAIKTGNRLLTLSFFSVS